MTDYDAKIPAYDAILLVSFGGPEKPEDVMPFLQNVTRGRNVPPQRLAEVAQHYYYLGGRSPINDQCRAIQATLRDRLEARGWHLPVYWGNRHWHPFLVDTIRQMAADGVHRALAVVTSAFGSYPSCRQYLEDIASARQAIGETAPQIDRVRLFFNHPDFLQAVADRAREALSALPPAASSSASLIFTAHSIPLVMAERSPYVAQLEEACRLVAEQLGLAEWRLAYQSRSGPPTTPWLEPDILDVLRDLAGRGEKRPVALVPIGFLSDHVELLYDLDVQAAALAKELGIPLVRAKTVGEHPTFMEGLCDLLEERLLNLPTRKVAGRLPPCPDVCPADCCRLG